MPVTWEIHDSIVLVTLAEKYLFSEPEEAVTTAMADARFRAGMSLLIDARRSTVSRSSDDFRERARWMASLVTQGLSRRFAIVISSDIHQYGLARMASIHLEMKNLDLEIFTDLAEARQWLQTVEGASDPRTLS